MMDSLAKLWGGNVKTALDRSLMDRKNDQGFPQPAFMEGGEESLDFWVGDFCRDKRCGYATLLACEIGANKKQITSSFYKD